MATQLNNLALTYRHLGQADEALPLQQRAQQITGTSAQSPAAGSRPRC
jgi:hypothetical protein